MTTQLDPREVVIRPFAPEFGEQTRVLISNIQRNEFGVPITLEDQPDLFDIPRVYQTHQAGIGSGEFWIAVEGERVVGTLALFDIDEVQSALRKMFVAKDHRGAPHRVGQRLLDTLLVHAEKAGLREVALGTTAVMHAAHRFYERNGFSEIPRSVLSARWPHNAVDVKFYRRVLERPAAR